MATVHISSAHSDSPASQITVQEMPYHPPHSISIPIDDKLDEKVHDVQRAVGGLKDEVRQTAENFRQDLPRSIPNFFRVIWRTIVGKPGRSTGNNSSPSYKRRLHLRQNDGHAHTVFEMLEPTLDAAIEEEANYTLFANTAGYALNTAIVLQVIINALVTALSAIVSPRHSQVMTTILGGLGTLISSYLAKARGSGEPDLSRNRARELQKFIRSLEAFLVDYGHETIGKPSNPGALDNVNQTLQNSAAAAAEQVALDEDTLRRIALEKSIMEFRRQFEEIEGKQNNNRQPERT
ncbi:hypothetical protein SISSUDRAFT_1066688 [Sistotremastrum suecicum HHB10207 ss-3]|uniref:SMODS and SLOG-associating 2TM effector domain-containing protein n=1 Tax=Sistotremastrum suecicum HHB10207 ss-3 TaxID=1314776 RepID=A0A165Y0U1_9AGAM|nr:hypothetical protein SISSUDRAFT_1066688 [Sistotremastrum suecicum HHB10207 ss-3]